MPLYSLRASSIVRMVRIDHLAGDVAANASRLLVLGAPGAFGTVVIRYLLGLASGHDPRPRMWHQGAAHGTWIELVKSLVDQIRAGYSCVNGCVRTPLRPTQAAGSLRR